MRLLPLLIIVTACRLLAAGPIAPGAVKVWVALRDKGPGAPSGRAFEDAPLYAPYLASLRAHGLEVGAGLKWQNLVSGYVSADALRDLRKLPFVRDVSDFPRKAKRAPMPFRPWRPFPQLKKVAAGLDYGQNKALAESLGVAKVHAWMAGQKMVPGKGIKIAVIDADFHMGNQIFDSLLQRRVKDQWDFVDDDAQAVDTELVDSHGAMCASLIGGNLPGTFVGMAPAATFLLYRSEDDFQERYVEEDYVAAAIERAVDSGAQVISISLGYRTEFTDGSPDLPYSQLDGKHRPSSIAAAKAAGRNVVVSVAVGNEADQIPGPSLGAPADADSILAVGIVDAKGAHCDYSSTGPSADGRVKPDVVTMGLAADCSVPVADPMFDKQTYEEAGTSFAAPALAGIAVLIRQIHPSFTAMQVRGALIETASRFHKPDTLVGYGRVNAAAAAGVPSSGLLEGPRAAGGYHQGGRGPFIMSWSPELEARGVNVVDFKGRNIPVTLRSADRVLLIDPDRDVRTGVYLMRASGVSR